MNQKYKNSYISAYNELVSLSVYNVGCQLCDAGYQWGPGIRNHYLIHYIISGKGSYRVGDTTYALSAGDAFLVYPNTEVIYRADDADPWEYAWVGFTGSDAAMILRATDFTPKTPCIFQVPAGYEIRHQLLHIYDARGNEFRHAVEMSGRLYTALALFMEGAHKKESEHTANTYVQKSIEYISANYSYPITVEDIAAYVGLSRSHLFRSFETVMQQSPKEYLTQFRMKQACDLLEHSDLSVTAIANSVGFDNSLYFSKSFRRQKGMPPREYRNAHGRQHSPGDTL
ncbi:MAG: AraC family transcriptional regulator [Agathobacter sp.]|nr:AraC family transcriptional regulator [Agathobacter sp.]